MYSDYSQYILNIRNNLIQCGVSVSDVYVPQEKNIDEDYFELFKSCIKFEDILYFYKILGVAGSEGALKGFFLPLNESYMDRVKRLAYSDYESDVLPRYVKLSGRGMSTNSILGGAEGKNWVLSDSSTTENILSTDNLGISYTPDEGDVFDSVDVSYLESDDFFNSMFDDNIDVAVDTVTSSSDVLNVIKVERGILLKRGIVKVTHGVLLSSFLDVAEYGDNVEDEEADESEYTESPYEDEEESEYEDLEESEYIDDEDWDEDEDLEESEYVDDEEDWEEESEYNEDEDLEESEYVDDEEDWEEESEYADEEDDWVEESEYVDDEDEEIEESAYEDDEDDWEEESDYGDDEDEWVDESSYDDKDEVEEVSSENRVSTNKALVEDTDLIDNLQNITNHALTSMKKGITSFLYRKE